MALYLFLPLLPLGRACGRLFDLGSLRLLPPVRIPLDYTAMTHCESKDEELG